MELRLSKINDLPEIKKIFQVSFNETDESTNFFFDNKFNLDNCIVCIVDEKVVSSLNIFDCKIQGNTENKKCVYIYGAATHPAYRNNGYMSKLIDFSNNFAFMRGYQYSILLPENENLYKYYSRLGYFKFFKIKNVEFNNFELKEYINQKFTTDMKMSYNNMYNLRLNAFKNNIGSIIWNKEHIRYACEMTKNYKGNVIFDRQGYAICYPLGGTLLVTELISNQNDIKNLISNIYNRYPNLNYKFRLPLFNSQYFQKEGKCSNL